MKINRYRKVHRILKFYSNNFGFRKPYQVLVDGTLCAAALKNKINVQEQFHKYLENEIKLLTTQCIIKEMEKLGSETFGALLIIKKFGVHQCGHGELSVPALDCILHMIGENNPSRYIIATQDRNLQQKCRKIIGVPLLYLHSRAPVLEAPSILSQTVANEKTASEFSARHWDQKKLIHLNADEKVASIKKKRKQKGGPNPLSCKKKKTPKESCEKKSNHCQKKRKRNRNKLVKKIKSEIISSLNL